MTSTIVHDHPAADIEAWLTANTRPGSTFGHIEAHTLNAEASAIMLAVAANTGWANVTEVDDTLYVCDDQGHHNLVRWAAAHGHGFGEVGHCGHPQRARVVDGEYIETADWARIPWTQATAAAHGVPSPTRAATHRNTVALVAPIRVAVA